MTRMLWILCSSIFLLAAMTGCQGTSGYYLGAQADAARVVSLPAETSHGLVWQDLNLTIPYDLKVDSGSVTVSGKIGFSGNPQVVYQRVYDMKVKFYLLDKDNRVISYREVARVLNYGLEELTDFKAEVKRPENAVAYTFGYEGIFIDEDQMSYQVWNLPKVGR